MNRLPNRSVLSVAAVLAGLAFAASPQAQTGAWKWRDAAGQTVYSDRPPPFGERVTQLRGPADSPPAGVSSTTPAVPGGDTGNAEGEPDATAAGARASATAAVASQPATPSWVEREKASRLQAAERAEADKRQADEARRAAEKSQLCDDARAGLRTLESGMRLNTIDANGERIVIDDAERARRAETMRRTLSENCAAKRG